MQQEPNKTNRWLKWIGGVAVVCLAIVGFWNSINTPPQIDIPRPVMPHPNGYNYFRRAGAAYVKDTQGVDEITNGMDVLTESSFSKHPKKYPLAAKEAWLKKNAKALQLLRQGLKYQAVYPSLSAYLHTISDGMEFRALARALAVESHAHAERGDWNGAVQSALDDYHFGNQVARGGALEISSVGGDAQVIGMFELSHLLSHTNATSAKMTAASLEKMYEQHYPFYKMMQQDKWINLDRTLWLMKSPAWRTHLTQGFRPSVVDYPQIFSISKQRVISDMMQSMNAAIENAQRPYTKQQPVSPSGDLLTQALLPDYKFVRWTWARKSTFAVEIMTMYALRAYRLDHGNYPESLQALVPMYLHTIPIDPFDGIAPLHYQLQGKKYLLWSIGPDGVDNHGKPITNKVSKYAGTAKHQLLNPSSKGDVVAGINKL